MKTIPRQYLIAAAMTCAMLSTGCSSQKRVVQTEQTLLMQRAENENSQREVFFGTVERLVDRIAAKTADKKEPATVDFLAMSGGGDKGAFGAGFLWLGAATDELPPAGI
jgi:hypothetical protein